MDDHSQKFQLLNPMILQIYNQFKNLQDHNSGARLQIKYAQLTESYGKRKLVQYLKNSLEKAILLNTYEDHKKHRFQGRISQNNYKIVKSNLNKLKQQKKFQIKQYQHFTFNCDSNSYRIQLGQNWKCLQKKSLFNKQMDIVYDNKFFRCGLSEIKFDKNQNSLEKMQAHIRDLDQWRGAIRFAQETMYPVSPYYGIYMPQIYQTQNQQDRKRVKDFILNQPQKFQDLFKQMMKNAKKKGHIHYQTELKFNSEGMELIAGLNKDQLLDFLGDTIEQFANLSNSIMKKNS